MKISLIQPPSDLVSNDRLEPPLGLMYLSSLLKENGHDVNVLDFSGGHNPEVTESDIFGFSTFTPSYSWCLLKQQELRNKFPKARMIAGGCHVSALPERCGKEWDNIILGEGEVGMLSLLDGNYQNIIQESVIKNIDLLPFPDYTGIDINTYDRKVDGKHVASVLTSRGCPFSCAFCNSNIWNNKAVRFRNPGHVVAEIEFLMDNFDTRHFRFVDDLFCVSEARIRELKSVLEPLKIRYRCNGRVSIFSESIAGLLVESGCDHIAFGAESGSNKILKRMNKRQTKQQIFDAIRIAKFSGMTVRAYVVVGFPGETWETLEETIELMNRSEPDEIIIFAPIPFPGTDIFYYPEDYGIYDIDKDFDKYSQISEGHETHYLLSHKTADSEEIKKMREFAVEELSQIAWVEGISNDINSV